MSTSSTYRITASSGKVSINWRISRNRFILRRFFRQRSEQSTRRLLRATLLYLPALLLCLIAAAVS